MPFTFAHPAAILPIYEKAKSRFDLTALILGSMAPDFEYFIRCKPLGLIGHGALGMLYFNLPLCILFAYVFHKIIKRPLILSLPKGMGKKLYAVMCQGDNEWSISSLRSFIVFVYSALIGMMTHVFWDGFTHKGAYFVNSIDALNYGVSIAGRSIPVYKFMQHGSTLIGFLILGIWLSKSSDKVKNYQSISNSYKQLSISDKLGYFAVAIAVCMVVVVVIAYVFKLTSITSSIGVLVVALINGAAIGITYSSLIYNKKKIK